MWVSSVITNKEQFLDEVINKILPSSSNVSFLVWFFYFSGFKQIYKNLKDKKVRLLIGMDTEQMIKELNFKVWNDTFINIQNTINNFKNFINKTDFFEDWEALEALEIFIKKIQDWSLEIRQTIEQNHAKIYLFENKEEFSQWWTYPGTIIMWSGNLTWWGMHGQWEFNMVIRDTEPFNSTLKYFDEQRENSKQLTTWWNDDYVVKVLKNETWLKLSDPYLCYMRLLSEYFKENQNIKYPSDITEWTFQDLEYQTDAIKKAMHIIEEHNWVIIADVVWLWKSIIWSTLLHNINEKAIIICPPHLEDQWKDYKKAFDFNAEIYTSWKIAKALYDDQDPMTTRKAWVILIDEAHKYRNADTIDYWNLHQLCQWKKVILLTATPFNNQPNDIFNLIKLFQIPNKPTIQTQHWLLQDFTELQNKYLDIKKATVKEWEELNPEDMKEIWQDIRQLIGPVVVRRSRVDLERIDAYKEDLIKQWYEISEVEDPKELTFDLWNLEPLYIETLTSLTEVDEEWTPINFKWARYNALWYLINPEKYADKIELMLWYDYSLLAWRQRNMPFFIRRLLVSRFESSIYAFKETLNSLVSSIDKTLQYIEQLKWMPVIKKWGLPDIEDLLDWADNFEYDEFGNSKITELLDKKNWFLIPLTDLKPNFVDDIKSDRAFIVELINKREEIEEDPKLDSFIERLKELREDKNRKIVVFSQYTATIDYLAEKLKWKVKVLKVTWSNKTEQLKKDIKYNFDAWAKRSDWKDDYDILLWTDAISEWYNLHRAWTIINYDIPYNPTKVIQRIGRINRINKKMFDKLYIYNYFPSLVWAWVVAIKAISVLKIKMIATILWIDVKTLTWDEPLWSFYKREMEKWLADDQEISWDTPYYNDFKNGKIEDPKLEEKIEKIPERTKIQREAKKNKKWTILFAKKWNNLLFNFFDSKIWENIPITIQEAFEFFKAEKEEQAKDVSEKFYEMYNKLKEELKSPKAAKALTKQEKDALENVKKMYSATHNPYFQLVEKVIELRSLPRYYMKKFRNVTPSNFESEMVKIKSMISEKYLNDIIKQAEEYDDEAQDLIISQEFIN